MRTWPSWNCVIIAPKWGVPNGNHMNDDVAEVNGSAPPMLPGSFLHKKEPGYEATVDRSKAVLPMPVGQLARCTADTYVGVATRGVATEFRSHLHLPLLSCQWSLQVQNKHTHCKSNIGLPVSLDHPAPSSTCHLPVLPLCNLWVPPPHTHTPQQSNQSIVPT